MHATSSGVGFRHESSMLKHEMKLKNISSFKEGKVIKDEHRFTIKISSLIETFSNDQKKDFDIIQKSISDSITSLLGDYVLNNGSYIFSTSEGIDQGWHSDYSDKSPKMKNPHYSIVYAISFYKLDFLTDDGKVRTAFLKPGDCVLFHGLAVHRGCSFQEPTCRYHWFVHPRDEVMSSMGCNVYFLQDQ